MWRLIWIKKKMETLEDLKVKNIIFVVIRNWKPPLTTIRHTLGIKLSLSCILVYFVHFLCKVECTVWTYIRIETFSFFLFAYLDFFGVSSYENYIGVHHLKLKN